MVAFGNNSPTPGEAHRQFRDAMAELKQGLASGLAAAAEGIDGIEHAAANIATAWGSVGDVEIAPKAAANVSAAMTEARRRLDQVGELTAMSADTLESLVAELHRAARAGIQGA